LIASIIRSIRRRKKGRGSGEGEDDGSVEIKWRKKKEGIVQSTLFLFPPMRRNGGKEKRKGKEEGGMPSRNRFLLFIPCGFHEMEEKKGKKNYRGKEAGRVKGGRRTRRCLPSLRAPAGRGKKNGEKRGREVKGDRPFFISGARSQLRRKGKREKKI